MSFVPKPVSTFGRHALGQRARGSAGLIRRGLHVECAERGRELLKPLQSAQHVLERPAGDVADRAVFEPLELRQLDGSRELVVGILAAASLQGGPSPLDLARDLRLEALGLFEVSGLETEVDEGALVDVFEARGDSAVVVPDPVALPKMAWSPTDVSPGM